MTWWDGNPALNSQQTISCSWKRQLYSDSYPCSFRFRPQPPASPTFSSLPRHWYHRIGRLRWSCLYAADPTALHSLPLSALLFSDDGSGSKSSSGFLIAHQRPEDCRLALLIRYDLDALNTLIPYVRKYCRQCHVRWATLRVEDHRGCLFWASFPHRRLVISRFSRHWASWFPQERKSRTR